MSQGPHSEASTPALEDFLQGAPLRRLFAHEALQRLHFLLAPERPAPEELSDDGLPLRIMVLWRLARTAAQATGLCAEDETLDQATELSPSPWFHPFKPFTGPTQQAALRAERASRLQRLHAQGDGLPLLPPRDDPEALERWCQAASIIAKDIGAERTEAARLPLEDLLQPARAARSDVTPEQVMSFEEMMLEECLDLLLDAGDRAAAKHYRDQYGFSNRECQGLIRLAKAQAMKRTAGAIEEKRSLQEARLENYLARAREAMNMGDEMKALVQLARVQGLTRSDPEDQAQEFLDVVRRVARTQDQQTIDAGSVRLLDAGRTEAVEAVVLPVHDDAEDTEALEEWDRENA
jgi:hypothetical protein